MNPLRHYKCGGIVNVAYIGEILVRLWRPLSLPLREFVFPDFVRMPVIRTLSELHKNNAPTVNADHGCRRQDDETGK